MNHKVAMALFVAVILWVSGLQAQHFEAGVSLGVASYSGDVSPSFFNPRRARPAGGLFGRYNFNNFLSAKASFTYGGLAGKDSDAFNVSRRQRNLSFRSRLMEFAVQGEFNLLGYQPLGLEKVFSPYIFLGVGVFNFDPKANYGDQWVQLQPLGTEGQGLPEFSDRKAYSRVAIAFPLGVGAKYALNDRWNLGLELGFRKTFTDYIDDVSQSYVSSATFTTHYGANSLNEALANRTGELPLEDRPENYAYDETTRRGDNRETDSYLLLTASISYNFLDSGLSSFRRRSKGGKGCKGMKF